MQAGPSHPTSRKQQVRRWLHPIKKNEIPSSAISPSKASSLPPIHPSTPKPPPAVRSPLPLKPRTKPTSPEKDEVLSMDTDETLADWGGMWDTQDDISLSLGNDSKCPYNTTPTTSTKPGNPSSIRQAPETTSTSGQMKANCLATDTSTPITITYHECIVDTGADTGNWPPSLCRVINTHPTRVDVTGGFPDAIKREVPLHDIAVCVDLPNDKTVLLIFSYQTAAETGNCLMSVTQAEHCGVKVDTTSRSHGGKAYIKVDEEVLPLYLSGGTPVFKFCPPH